MVQVLSVSSGLILLSLGRAPSPSFPLGREGCALSGSTLEGGLGSGRLLEFVSLVLLCEAAKVCGVLQGSGVEVGVLPGEQAHRRTGEPRCSLPTR